MVNHHQTSIWDNIRYFFQASNMQAKWLIVAGVIWINSCWKSLENVTPDRYFRMEHISGKVLFDAKCRPPNPE